MKAPPARKLRNFFLKDVQVTKHSYANSSDAYGQKIEYTNVTYTVKAEIQEITSKDLALLQFGEAELGDAWGWFLPVYDINHTEVIVDTEDTVSWSGKQWKVDYVEDHYVGNTPLFRRAFLKRVIGNA